MTGTHRFILAATILGSAMVFIDGTAVNVILPLLQTDLHANAVQLQWTVVGYTLFLSSLMLAGGSLGDHYGRRAMFVAGTVVFALASVACGLAPNAAALVAARCVQGVGSALLTPGSLAIIGATFGERERGQAIGTWSSATAVTAAIGPGLGGWLAQHASWRWIFFINVPIAVAVVAIALLHVPETKDAEVRHRVDWAGTCACTAGLGALVYGLTFSSTWWSIAGLALLGLFVWLEATRPAPLVPLRLFASKTFSGVNILTLLLYGALGAAMFFLPFELIQIDGYSPTAAGFSFLPFIACVFVLSPLSGALMPKTGARLPLVVGPLLAGVGFLLFARAAGHVGFWAWYFPATLAIGCGMGIAVAPLTTTVMTSVDAQRMGTASGVNNAVSRVAGMLAIAGLGTLLFSLFSNELSSAMTAQHVPRNVYDSVMSGRYALAATTAPASADAAMREQARAAVVAAYLTAFRAIMVACAGLAVLGAAVAAFTIPGRRRAVASTVATPAPVPGTPR